MYDEDRGLFEGEIDSIFVFAHELCHADRAMRGIMVRRGVLVRELGLDGEDHEVVMHYEECAVMGFCLEFSPDGLANITENDIRKEHGAPLRMSYTTVDRTTDTDAEDVETDN